MADNSNLQKANKAKQDEFYTQLSDSKAEIQLGVLFLFFILLILSSGVLYGFVSLWDIVPGSCFILLFHILSLQKSQYKFLYNSLYTAFFSIIIFFTATIFIFYKLNSRTFEIEDFYLICDSSFPEIQEFISDRKQFLPVAGGLASTLIFISAYYCSGKMGKKKFSKKLYFQNKKIYILTGLLNILCLFIWCMKSNIIGIAYPRQVCRIYLAGVYNAELAKRDFLEGRLHAKNYLKKGICSKEKSDLPVTCILIIGESATAHAMNCYGHPVKNTPFLSRKQKINSIKGDFILLKNCFALDNLTTAVLPQILSNSDYTNPLSIKNSILIFDICNFLNINSFIITNQAAAGTSISNLTEGAQHTVYAFEKRLKNTGLLDRTTPPDEVVLPYFTQILSHLNQDQNNLIILHLFGSHFPYKNRLPANYIPSFGRNKYSKTEFYYFQTIEYTDRLLQEICKTTKKKLIQPYVICYVSDHGEDPTGKTGRGQRNIQDNIPAFFAVPCIFFLSEKYSSLYPDKMKFLKENRNKIFLNEHIFDTLLGIFNISVNDSYISHETKNIFSKKYEQNLNGVKILNYQFPLETMIKNNSSIL